MADQMAIGRMEQEGDFAPNPIEPMPLPELCGTCDRWLQLTDSDRQALSNGLRQIDKYRNDTGRRAVVAEAMRRAVGVCALDAADPVVLRTCGCLHHANDMCDREDGSWVPSESYERRFDEQS